MQHRTWRRRNYFIRKEFQGKFVLRFFLTILIGAVLFTVIFSLFSANTITVTYEDSVLKIDKTPRALFVELVRAYGVYIFLIGLGISLVSVFLSHRIAGPVYRLEKTIEEVAKGNLALRITLRRKDELKELATSINGMMSTLSDRIRDVKDRACALEREMVKLWEGVRDEAEEPGGIREIASKALRSTEDLKRTLTFFRLDQE